MQHSSLENGRWAELSFPQQMANIGSETSRVYRSLAADKEARAESAFVRFQELFCAAFLSRDLSELASLNKYLDQFALIR